MKILNITLILFFSLTFLSTSFADWKHVSQENNNNFYIDETNIRKKNGYVFFWDMINYNGVPSKFGDLSAKSYNQGDCNLFRYKRLSYSFHKKEMAKGIAKRSNNKNPSWIYPAPRTHEFIILTLVCEF